MLTKLSTGYLSLFFTIVLQNAAIMRIFSKKLLTNLLIMLITLQFLNFWSAIMLRILR